MIVELRFDSDEAGREFIRLVREAGEVAVRHGAEAEQCSTFPAGVRGFSFETEI